MRDEFPFRSEAQPTEQVALRTRDIDIGRYQRPPGRLVGADGQSDRNAGDARASVAAMHYARNLRAVRACVADAAVAVEIATGACQPIIVDRGNNGNARIAA